jgi:hypothetical protein
MARKIFLSFSNLWRLYSWIQLHGRNRQENDMFSNAPIKIRISTLLKLYNFLFIDILYCSFETFIVGERVVTARYQTLCSWLIWICEVVSISVRESNFGRQHWRLQSDQTSVPVTISGVSMWHNSHISIAFMRWKACGLANRLPGNTVCGLHVE